MSGKLKVLALLNLIGWAIVVPVLVSSLVSPLLDYSATPGSVGSGKIGATQLAPLSQRPSGGEPQTQIGRPVGRRAGEQLPIPVLVLRQAGVATPARTGPLTDGIPSNGIVRVQPGPGGVESVQIVSTGVTEGAIPSLPDTPGTGTIVSPSGSPDPVTGEPGTQNFISPSPELPSPSNDGGQGQTAEAPPVLPQTIITEPTADVPTPEAPSVPTPDATDTATPAPTDTATPAPTDTATPEPTDTATPAPTDTATPAPTDTATPAPTDTATPAPTDTATPAPTYTATEAPTETATAAPTDTPTAAPTDTATPAPTYTATPAPTSTPDPPQGPNDPPNQQNHKAPLAVADRPKAVVEAKLDAPDDDE